MGLLLKCGLCGQYVGEEPSLAEYQTEEEYYLAEREFEERRQHCPHNS